MKKLIFITLSAIVFINSSCQKEEKVKSPEENLGYRMISTFFGMEDQKEFTVLTTSSSGASLFTDFDLENTLTGVQAGSIEESNEGLLEVNAIEVPFSGESYWLQTDSTLLATEFVGGINNYELESLGSIPDFDIDKYCPEQTDLSYSGLLNKRLPRNSDLTISWSPDGNLPSFGKAGFILLSEDDNTVGKIPSDIYEVNDAAGQYTFDASILSEFTQDRITVMYVRGYHEIEDIEGVEVDFQFIGHTWTTLLFVD